MEASWARYVMVMLGAAVGGGARYALVTASIRLGGRFPWGTFVVNMTGCFLIGLAMTILTERFPLYPNLRLLLVVGVLGGYTTYSSFEFEAYQSFKHGAAWIGLGYVLASVIVGYLAVWCGAVLATRR